MPTIDTLTPDNPHQPPPATTEPGTWPRLSIDPSTGELISVPDVRAPWSGVLAVLGMPTTDGRIIAVPDGFPSTRPLPLPLMDLANGWGGHEAAFPSGLIERVWITTDERGVVTLNGSGTATGVLAVRLANGETVNLGVDLCDASMSIEGEYSTADTWSLYTATCYPAGTVGAFPTAAIRLGPATTPDRDAATA